MMSYLAFTLKPVRPVTENANANNCVTHSKSVHLLPLGSKHTVHLVPQNTFYNKLEVSRLDSSYTHTLSWCQMVVRIQIAFKTIPTPENWETESKEDLTVIELSETDGFTHKLS